MKLFFVPRLSICCSSAAAVVRYANVATFRKSLWQTRQAASEIQMLAILLYHAINGTAEYSRARAPGNVTA